MKKTQAVAALGQRKLMLPSWVKAASSANDRLEVYLTVLRAAASHASHPDREPPDLAKEIASAGLSENWLQDVSVAARQVNDELLNSWLALGNASQQLEHAFADMQDFQFTVQEGRLFMLQTRAGKTTPEAAARIALDMLGQGLITADVVRERTSGLDRKSLGQSRIVAQNGAAPTPLARAATASSGVAVGEIALGEARAVARSSAGTEVVLVRRDAETSDIAALQAATGLLAQRGARTSHAAVVARQLGKVCLVGCAELRIDDASRTIKIGDTTLREDDLLSFDGNGGCVYAGAVQTELEYPTQLLARPESLRQRSVGVRIDAPTGQY